MKKSMNKLFINLNKKLSNWKIKELKLKRKEMRKSEVFKDRGKNLRTNLKERN